MIACDTEMKDKNATRMVTRKQKKRIVPAAESEDEENQEPDQKGLHKSKNDKKPLQKILAIRKSPATTGFKAPRNLKTEPKKAYVKNQRDKSNKQFDFFYSRTCFRYMNEYYKD